MHKNKHVLVHFRRKLRADVAATFPSLSAEQLSEVVPNKEELNVIKLYTHKGDAVTVYANSRNPTLFELEKRLYPTGTERGCNWEFVIMGLVKFEFGFLLYSGDKCEDCFPLPP